MPAHSIFPPCVTCWEPSVLFSALLLRGQSLRPPALVPVVLIGLAQTMGFQALVQWALVDGGAGKTALFAYTMPFWVALLGRLLLSDRLSARHVWGIVGAALGLLLIIAPWQGVGGLKPVLLAIAGGFCWGLGTVLSKREFQRGTVSTLSLTAWQMLFGTLGPGAAGTPGSRTRHSLVTTADRRHRL